MQQNILEPNYKTFLSTEWLLNVTNTLRTKIPDRGKLKTVRTVDENVLHLVGVNPTISRKHMSQ